MIFSINHYFKKDRKFLWFLSFLSLIIRLLFYYFFLTDNSCQLMYDSGQYHAVANALVHGNGFTNADGSPHFYRLPGYPIFLGAVYALLGINPTYAMMIQIIFSSLIPLLISMLFLLFFPGAVVGARIAGLLASVHVGFLIFSGLVMTETFFLFFFLLFCLFFFSGDRWIFAGIFLGIASLFRPVGHYLVVVTLALMVIKFICGVLTSVQKDQFDVKHIPNVTVTPGFFVILAKAGIQILLFGLSLLNECLRIPFLLLMHCFYKVVTNTFDWIPAFARMTKKERNFSFKIFFRTTVRSESGMTNAEESLIGVRHQKCNEKKWYHMQNLLLFLLGWLIVITPWLARNYMLTGSLFFHSLSGPHFLNHGAVRVVMAHNKISYDQAKMRVIRDYETLLSMQKVPLDEPMRSRIAEKLAFKIMCAHPFESIKLCVINMLKTVFSLYSSELIMIDSKGSLPPYECNRSFFGMLKKFLIPTVNNSWIIVVIYSEILFFLLMLFATGHYLIGALFNRQRFLQILPIMVFSALFIGLSCVCGFARLRITLEPFLLIFTAYFLYNLFVCFQSVQIFCGTQSRW